MEEKLFDFAKKIWVEGFYFTRRGQSSLKTKCELYKLDPEIISRIDSKISLLQDGLDYLKAIAGNDALTELAREELKEFCEIKDCFQDMELILNSYTKIASSDLVPSDESETSSTVHTLAISEEADQVGEEVVNDIGTSGQRNPSEPIPNDNIIWIGYRNKIISSISNLQKSVQSVSSCAELLKIGLTNRVRETLKDFEEDISTSLITRGHLENPEPYFQGVRGDLLSYISDFTNELSVAVSDNNRQLQYFKDMNQGGTGYLGVGSLGFVAGVAAVNGVRSIFSGIGRAHENRKFSNKLDEQLWNEILPIIKNICDGLAEVLIRYYDSLSKNLGLLSFDEMSTAFEEADYILSNLEKIEAPSIRVEALRRAFNTFPFQGKHWLKVIGESLDTPEKSLELIKLAAPFYIGEIEDLKCIEYQILRELGKNQDALALASSFNERKNITFNISGTKWPLSSKQLPTSQKIAIDCLLISNSLHEFVNSNVENIELLEPLFSKTDKNESFAYSFIELLVAIVKKDFSKAREIGGPLILWADTPSQKKLLVVLSALGYIPLRGKVSPSTFDEFSKSIGLKADQTIQHWSGKGGEFSLMESFKLFLEGKQDMALECVANVSPTSFGKCWSNRIEWPFKLEFEDAELVRAGQILYVEFLRRKIWLYPSAQKNICSLLRTTLNKSVNPFEWSAAVAEGLVALSKPDIIKLNSVLQVFKPSANFEMSAFICAIELSATLESGNKDELPSLVEKLLARSYSYEDISKNWDCTSIKSYFDQKTNDAYDRLTPWAHTTIKQIYDLLPNMIKASSLLSLTRPFSISSEVCKAFTDQVPDTVEKINSDHLVAYWSSEKSFGLILSYGFFFIDHSKTLWYELSPFGVEKVDESGWVNAYVRIKHLDSEYEIPYDFSGPDRGNIDASFSLIDEISLTWQESVDDNIGNDICSVSADRLRAIFMNTPAFPHNIIELQSDLNLLTRQVKETATIENQGGNVGFSLIRQAVNSQVTDKSIKVWFAPHIDMEKASALIKKLPGTLKIRQSDIVVYYDDTAFGAGDDGALITDTHLFYCPLMEDPTVIELSTIKGISISGMLNKTLKISTSAGELKVTMTGSNKGVTKIYDAISSYLDLTNKR